MEKIIDRKKKERKNKTQKRRPKIQTKTTQKSADRKKAQ